MIPITKDYEMLIKHLVRLAESWANSSAELRLDANSKVNEAEKEVLSTYADIYAECEAELFLKLVGYIR